MANFGFSSSIKVRGKEYLLQTSNNAFQNRIICSLFEGGSLINSQEISYDPQISDEALLALVKSLHDEKREETASLLKLSEELIGSNQAEAKNRVGLAFLEKGMYQEAIAEFQDAIKANPGLSKVYNNLGKAYLAAGKAEEAISAFQKALNIDPQYADYHNNLGAVYLKSEKCKLAADSFQKALGINPYYGEAYYNLGLALILNGIIKEDYLLATNLKERALEAMEKAAVVNPGFRNEHFDEAKGLLTRDELEEAWKEFNQAKAEENVPQAESLSLDFYLRFLHKEDEIDDTTMRQYIQSLEDFARKNPHFADVHNDLGIAHTVLCKYINERAIQHFREAIKINPNYEKARRNLKLAENDSKGFHLLLKVFMK
jgi:tetratricopeptide (TPR) repeat protein